MRNLAMVGVMVLVAMWSVWPVVVRPGRIADYGSDGWFINWAINRAGKNIWDCFGGAKRSCGHLFDGNIFYPNKNVLAYSDMFFVSGFWTHWLTVLSKNPGVASGLVMGAGQVFTMLISYFWFNNLTKNRWSAVVGAVTFGLSQIRWEYRAHMHTWTMQYWLLGSWLLCSWLKDNKTWKLILGVVLLGLQMWESPLPTYFSLAIIGVWAIFNFPFDFAQGRQFFKHLLSAALLFGVIVFPVVRVYSGVAKEFGFVRSIRDAAHGGMSIDDLATKFFSPGLYVLTLLALIKISKFEFLNPKQIQNSNTKFLLAVLMIGLVMAMGPVLKWQGRTVKIGGRYPVPLPYAALYYYVVPGMKAFREPSRWILVVGFGMSGIIAIGLTNTSPYPSPNLGEGIKGRGIRGLGVLGAIVVAIVGGVHSVKYIDLPKADEIPLVYRQLDEKCRVIVEVPMGGDDRESKRMYYSLYHGRYLVNGFSGFSPPTVLEGIDCKINWQDEKVGIDYL